MNSCFTLRRIICQTLFRRNCNRKLWLDVREGREWMIIMIMGEKESETVDCLTWISGTQAVKEWDIQCHRLSLPSLTLVFEVISDFMDAVLWRKRKVRRDPDFTGERLQSRLPFLQMFFVLSCFTWNVDRSVIWCHFSSLRETYTETRTLLWRNAKVDSFSSNTLSLIKETWSDKKLKWKTSFMLLTSSSFPKEMRGDKWWAKDDENMIPLVFNQSTTWHWIVLWEKDVVSLSLCRKVDKEIKNF